MRSTYSSTPQSRSLQVNQDKSIYGTFAEIGAGQEVARHFFMAGQASQTIAKTISAYDMKFSDEIYGREAGGRYVCESRLQKMLDKEFSLLLKRLGSDRGDQSRFFSFANTVATGEQGKRNSHGWMGVKFQTEPGGEPNEVHLHIRMMDKYRLQQQEALGVLGVNLVHSVFFSLDDPKKFIECLVQNIRGGQIILDFIQCQGPALSHFNNHLLNLDLVRRGWAEGILFSPSGEILSLGDALYEKSVVIERGSFRPVTNSHVDLLERGLKKFKREFPGEKNPLVLFEITMNSLNENNTASDQDFLDRVRTLSALGHHVLVSQFFLFYKLKRFLRQYTQKPIGLIVGASLLGKLFDPEYYKDLEGGILEGLGKLLDSKTHVWVYPSKSSQVCMTCENFHPDHLMSPIFQFFRQKEWISDTDDCDSVESFVTSESVLKKIKSKDRSWEKDVPAEVKDLIRSEKLFGFKN